jgi:hypothetical protein
MSSALRGICEDLIVLKFLRRLNRSERDQVVTITMGLALGEALAKQDAFFKKNRPFQPILRAQSDRSRTEALRDRLTAIGQASGLWNTRGRLKPIEQMASDVKLRPLYEFMYAVTSEGVHFNPRIALRHGWGGMTKQRFSGRFSTGHYSRYYLFFCQAYGIYLFEAFCRTFKTNLSLSHAFMNRVTKLRSQLDLQIRWPEAVTFEEMNMQDPGLILRSVLQVIHEEKIKKGEARKVLQALAALESGN